MSSKALWIGTGWDTAPAVTSHLVPDSSSRQSVLQPLLKDKLGNGKGREREGKGDENF